MTSLFSASCPQKYLDALNDIIKANQSTVISTTYCPYCTKAKRLLD
jgi:glutaredoxin 3